MSKNGVAVPYGSLSASLSSTVGDLVASNCVDGNTLSNCQSSICLSSSQGIDGKCNLATIVCSDATPTLTVSTNSAVQNFDTIAVYNRIDCCQLRIQSATISVLDPNGSIIFSGIFSGVQSLYQFQVPIPNAPSVSPLQQPTTGKRSHNFILSHLSFIFPSSFVHLSIIFPSYFLSFSFEREN